MSIPAGNEWIVGVLINVIGSVTINFGTNVMKSAHNIAGKMTSHYKSLATKNPDPPSPARGAASGAAPGAEVDPVGYFGKDPSVVWRLGMFVFVLGSIINFVSFAFAAQSLLACLGTVQFISNVFFAKLVLKEQLTSRILYATGVIVLGLVLAISLSNHAETSYTVGDLRNLYTYKYICFTIGELCVLCALQYVYLKYTKSAEQGVLLPGHRLVVPCCYAQVSAAIGTQSLLQSKCIAELLKATIEGDNQFTKPFTYVIILGFLTGISFWLYRMNAALKQFEGLIIIPLLQVFWTTSAILQGGVYFQEFEKFTTTQMLGFTTGVIIVFCGVYMLVPTGNCNNTPGSPKQESPVGEGPHDQDAVDEESFGLLSTHNALRLELPSVIKKQLNAEKL
jgi:hypothetical protein